jgi:hypothetical protein
MSESDEQRSGPPSMTSARSEKRRHDHGADRRRRVSRRSLSSTSGSRSPHNSTTVSETMKEPTDEHFQEARGR